jgi:hypothetical protein
MIARSLAGADTSRMKTPLLPVNPALSRSPLITCLVVAVVVLALQLWLFQPIMLGFFPTLDEIPLQVASTAIAGPVNPWLWITHGFEGFYVPYPEWPGPANDFWRPLVNVLYWLRYQLSGEHLSSALLVGYLAHAAIVGIVCFVALRLFRLSPLATFGAVAIAALNPAYVYHSMLDPYHVPRGHDWHSVLLHGSELLINLAWWAALVAAIVVAYRAWGRRWLTQQPEPWLIGLVFALGNLVAVLLLPATELRYAYFWFALGPRGSVRCLVTPAGRDCSGGHTVRGIAGAAGIFPGRFAVGRIARQPPGRAAIGAAAHTAARSAAEHSPYRVSTG